MTMRTWSLNVEEYLLLAHKTKIPKLLTTPTSAKKWVGKVAIAIAEKDVALLRKKKTKAPLQPKDFGLIDFISPRGTVVQLVGKDDGVAHEDGASGEVFLRTYTARKKAKAEELPGSRYLRFYLFT